MDTQHVLGLALAAAVTAILVATVRAVRTRPSAAVDPHAPPDPPAPARAASAPRASGPAFSPGATDDAPATTPGSSPPPAPTPRGPAALSPREQRAEQARARRETGACLYCSLPASRATPRLVPVRPLLDPLYRRLGAVPVNRWRLELEPGTDAPIDVCEAHQSLARAHLERRVAEVQVEYAAFVERQRAQLYEFGAYGLDERMAREASDTRRGRPPRGAATTATGEPARVGRSAAASAARAGTPPASSGNGASAPETRLS
jgi:hypothetical protein